MKKEVEEPKQTFFKKIQQKIGLASKPVSMEKFLQPTPEPAKLAGTGSAGPISTAKKI